MKYIKNIFIIILTQSNTNIAIAIFCPAKILLNLLKSSTKIISYLTNLHCFRNIILKIMQI